MMWLGVYQSAMCWLLSGPCTSPTQSLTSPQVQIGDRPIQSRIAAAATAMPRAMNQYLRGMSGAWVMPRASP